MNGLASSTLKLRSEMQYIVVTHEIVINYKSREVQKLDSTDFSLQIDSHLEHS
jgi:hypothetical protein